MHIDVIQANTATPIQAGKAGLKSGDVVQGKVSASADGKVSITLQDGSVMGATLDEGVSLAEGQNVKLMVTGQQDGRITMQIVPEGDNAQKVIESALSNLSINGNGKNVELATSFIRQGISLSPELMQKAADILAKNPGIDADTAVFMAANGMDADLGQAVQNLAAKQNGINSQLATLEGILIENGAQPEQGQAATGSSNGAVVNAEQPAQGEAQPVNQQAAAPQGEAQATQPQAPQADGGKVAGQAAQQPPQQEAIQQGNPPQQAQPSAQAPQQGGAAANTGAAAQPVNTQPNTANAQATQAQQPSQAAAGEATAAQTPQQGVAPNTTTAQTAQAQPAQAQPAQAQPTQAQAQTAQAQPTQPQPAAVFQPGPETVKALTLYIGRDNPSAVTALQADGLNAAATTVSQAASLPERQGKAVIQAFVAERAGGMEAADASKLQSQLSNAAQALRDTVQPQQGSGLNELLGKLEAMFAKLDKPSKSVDIKHAANRLPERLEDMQEAIGKAAVGAAGKEAMSAAVQRAVGQSKAMEQINQFVYTQIPMNMNGQKNMAELYVFKRPGRQKRIDAEQVTMVIALDTQNMGHVESLIKVDMKNVFLRFKVDDGGIAGALEAGMAEAAESLRDIGYNLLELKCELNEEEINILNATSTVQTEFLDVRKLDFFI